jgi:hypothetical protein
MRAVVGRKRCLLVTDRKSCSGNHETATMTVEQIAGAGLMVVFLDAAEMLARLGPDVGGFERSYAAALEVLRNAGVETKPDVERYTDHRAQ